MKKITPLLSAVIFGERNENIARTVNAVTMKLVGGKYKNAIIGSRILSIKFMLCEAGNS